MPKAERFVSQASKPSTSSTDEKTRRMTLKLVVMGAGEESSMPLAGAVLWAGGRTTLPSSGSTGALPSSGHSTIGGVVDLRKLLAARCV
eukprot:scaffold186636_cov25-Tisochrysis_lutea.AAC.2